MNCHLIQRNRDAWGRSTADLFATNVSGLDEPAHKLFPWVHSTLANPKCFLLGTQHAVEGKHLPGYVAEFNYGLTAGT